MRPLRFSLALAAVGALLGPARAADPLAVELRDSAAVGTALVTVGDVAAVSGGDAATRARVERIDLAELRARDPGATIGRRNVEYRLILAGIDARVTGAERVAVSVARRPVTAEEVAAAARAELLRYYPTAGAVELALPVVVKLPEVPRDERVVVAGRPHNTAGATGRVQMDMTLSAGGELLLSFPVHFDVRARADAAAGRLPPAAAAGPQAAAGPAGGEVLVRAGEGVRIVVTCGAARIAAAGLSLQSGRMGQTIAVRYVDSTKVLSARVSGPGAVEMDAGGAP